MKFALTAAILLLVPGVATAQCVGDQHRGKEVTMSCAPGTVLDLETGFCVPETTS
jgi:hypothetical protein